MAYWIIDTVRVGRNGVENCGTREGPFSTREEAIARLAQLRQRARNYIGQIAEESE